MGNAVSENVQTTSILKILQCTNLGGMEQVAYGLMRDLQSNGQFRFRVLTPRPFGDGELILRTVDPQAADFDYAGKYGWRTLPRFRHLVKDQASLADCIWVTGTCACSLAAIQGIQKRKVLSHHFTHFNRPGDILRWFGFYHLLCRQLSAVIFPTDLTRNEAVSVAPWLRPKTHVVRHGYTAHYEDEPERLKRQAAARDELNLPEDAFIVGNAGWLTPGKRFDVFLETAARVRAEVPNAYFVICGGGPEEERLRQKANELGLADAIRFTGWVRNLVPYYQAWDVCLFNSDAESFGRTPVEAAAHGCLPVASITYGGLQEFLTHNENGVLLDRHDSQRLAREIVGLSRNPARAIEFREAATDKLRREYDPAVSAAIHRSLLNC